MGEINQIFPDKFHFKFLSCAHMALRPGVPAWDSANSIQLCWGSLSLSATHILNTRKRPGNKVKAPYFSGLFCPGYERGTGIKGILSQGPHLCLGT